MRKVFQNFISENYVKMLKAFLNYNHRSLKHKSRLHTFVLNRK